MVKDEIETAAKTKWQAFLDYTAKNPGFWTGAIAATVLLLVLRGCVGG